MKLCIAFSFEIFLPAINGVITSTANLAQHLIQQGHEVYCVVPKWRKSPDSLLPEGAKVIPLPSFRSIVYPGLRFVLPWVRPPEKLFEQYGINIVHITAPGTIARKCLQAAEKLNIPVVHTWHTMLSDKRYLKHLTPIKSMVPIFEKLSWKYYKPYIYRSNIVTSPSPAVTHMLQHHYPEIPIMTVKNGVDLSSFQQPQPLSALQQRLPNFNEKSLLFLGRVSHEKSIDIIIHAVAKAARQIEGLTLFIIGDGPAFKALEKLTRDLKLSTTVYFVGALSHQEIKKSGILYYARALISASESETQGITFVEALCCNTPVIAIDSPVTRDTIGQAGIFVPPADINAFADAITTIQLDNKKYQALKDSCQQQVKQFDGEEISKVFVDLYTKLLPT